METSQPRNYKGAVWVLSGLVIGLIGLAYFLPDLGLVEKADVNFIPLLNAMLNSTTFVCLAGALVAIRRKRIGLHRALVFGAFAATSLFLVSYLVYHFNVPSTKYGGTGLWRTGYLLLLLTHIVLAAAIVPMALLTMARGLNMEVSAHRAIARWTMPIWLYVSATGVIVYVLIRPYY